MGDELITGRWLWDRDTAFVEILLEIRFRPGGIKPVARVRGVFTKPFCKLVVILSSGCQKAVSGARLRMGNVVVIKEALEGGFSPAVEISIGRSSLSATTLPIKDPVLDTVVGVGALVIGFGGRVNNLGLPVLLDEIFQIFPIRWSRVGDIMIGEPSFKLSLVPLVVN